MQNAVHVLHVDDDPGFAETAAEFLEREDQRIAVRTATSAEAGIDRLRDRGFDCVVSDYEMPGRNGIEFLEAVREIHSGLPFILYTGKGSEEIASEAISAGVSDYFQKERGTDQYTVLANKITTAVEAGRARRAQNRQLEAIETAREGISILDEDGRFIYVNETYGELYGYDPEAMIGEHWELLYRDDDVAQIHNEILPEVIESGHWRGTTTGLRADGSTFLEDHALATTEHDELVCTVRNLDEGEEGRFLDTLLQSLPDLLYAFDSDGTLVRWNAQLAEVTGYSEDELEAMSATDFVPGDEAERITETFETILEDRRSMTVQSALRTKAGNRIPYEFTASSLEDATGAVHGVIGVGRDITERREFRRKLRLFRNAVEDTGHSIYFTDRSGTIEYVNPAFEETTGYSAQEAIGMTPRMLKSGEHDREFYEELWETILSGDVWRNEIVNRDKSGERYVVDQTIAPIENDDGDITHFVAINADVTSQRESEETIKRQNERLEEFASIVTHDLRTPLNVATGRVELASAECESEHHGVIADALDRMERLVDDVLWLSAEGRQIGTTEPVELREMIEAAWTIAADKADEAELIYEQANDRALIEADPDRLRQVFENLLTNAIEHAGPDVTVRVETTDTGFAIEDDGPGVPRENRHRVFDTGHTTAQQGTGLGLSIVEQIVEGHDWDIRITDANNGGARFEITGVEFVEA